MSTRPQPITLVFDFMSEFLTRAAAAGNDLGSVELAKDQEGTPYIAYTCEDGKTTGIEPKFSTYDSFDMLIDRGWFREVSSGCWKPVSVEAQVAIYRAFRACHYRFHMH